jgi:hypothetical protein
MHKHLEMKIKRKIFLLAVISAFFGQNSYSQTNSCENVDRELQKIYSKMFHFYQCDEDSLYHYSDMFSDRMINYIKTNPESITCKFKMLTDSNDCHIVTTDDGLFRIYSWDTWQGGTMHEFKNIFQYKSGNRTYAESPDEDEFDFGSYFTMVNTLKTNGTNYFLAVGGGSESTKDAYEFIKVYSVSGSNLNDSVPLIKTSGGLKNSISFEFDFFSVVDRPERPLQLIKYDADKKIIYIPIVLENGKVTSRFIMYQFTGQYFEKISTQKNTGTKK